MPVGLPHGEVDLEPLGVGQAGHCMTQGSVAGMFPSSGRRERDLERLSVCSSWCLG